MARSGKGNRRVLPSTPPTVPDPSGRAPDDRDAHEDRDAPAPDDRGGADASRAAAAPGTDGPARPAAARQEPEYLIKGTGCTAGHERGHELDAGRLGRVPTRKGTRIGLVLVLWCVLGVGFFVDLRWLRFGLQVLVLWLALAAIVVRRAGHQGRCWRTRTWRHAWGGLAPTGKDPTRPAGT